MSALLDRAVAGGVCYPRWFEASARNLKEVTEREALSSGHLQGQRARRRIDRSEVLSSAAG